MEHIFGEDDYSDGKHDNIDEKDIDLEGYVDCGEADYDKLFNSDWCPLLGRMPNTNYDDSSCENLSVGIIYNARKLWGIKPMRIYTPTDNRIESTDNKPKGLHKYPQLRLDAAQAIARTYPKVKNEADIIDYEEDGQPHYANNPFDENWEYAIRIVKDSIAPKLNEQIKDYHILSILAIAEAWDVLKNVLSLNKSEGNQDIASQVRVETALLGKAKELFLEEKNKQLEQDVEKVKNDLWKNHTGSKGENEQHNKAETIVYDWGISEARDVYCNEEHIAKLSKLQFKLFKCLYKKPGKYIRNKTLEECWENKLPSYTAFLSDTMGELNATLKKGLKERHITIKNRVIEPKQENKKNIAYKLVT